MTSPRLNVLDHIVLTVRDIEICIAFYTDVLGMEHVSFPVDGEDRPRHALSFGTSKINLHQAGAEFEPKAATPVPGSADLCFLSAEPIDIWTEHLAAQDVTVEIGPVPRTGATGALRSIYIRDPDGNLIEISNPV